MLSITLLWLALARAIAPPPCAACDCIGRAPVEEAVEGADAVFIGRVLGVNQMAEEVNDTRTPAMLLVVEEMKGTLPPAVLVSTSVAESLCGYRFEVGRRYLVYAVREPEDERPSLLATHICMRTSRLPDVSEEELAYLRAYE